MIQYVASFFKSLNANANPGDIAHAVSLGLLLAILPKNNLTFTFLFFFTLFIRINKGAFFIAFILLGFITPFMDILINRIGFWAVQLQVLRPMFLWCENTPFIGLFKLSNTMVFGGLILGALLYIPMYMLMLLLISEHRKYMQPSLKATGKRAGLFAKIPLLKKLSKISYLKDSF